MIAIIDAKMGNVGSIFNMLKKIGFESRITSDPKEIMHAEKVILPGVGSFDAGMNKLRSQGFIPVLERKVLTEHAPVLGICLGMQLFAQRSEEGLLDGLGWLPGEVKKFRFDSINLKIPHMGWNSVSACKQDHLLADMPKEPRFYFVHSYHFVCSDRQDELLTTNYGKDFVSAVRRKNIIGVQFHPEKSHKYGMQLLNNFAKFG